MYTYAWYHWLTFFYLYCFFGWIFESAYVSLRQRRPVNRGFLRLPMLPLYGTGAVMMLWVSIPVQDSLVLVYLSGFAAATLLEYVTGYGMELLFKVRYWDYSDQKFNVNGYICLSSSIAWGFLTIFMTEVIHRPIARLVLNLNPFFEWGILAVITVLFVTDTVQSTKDALDLAQALEAATRLRGELDEMQVQIALLKAELAQDLQERMEEHSERIQSFKQELQELRDTQMEERRLRRESQEERLRALNEAFAEKTAAMRQHMSAHRRIRLLRRNPSAASRQFAAALGEFKASFEEHLGR